MYEGEGERRVAGAAENNMKLKSISTEKGFGPFLDEVLFSCYNS